MKLSRRIILLLIIAAVMPLLAVFISLTVYANRQRDALINMRLTEVYGGAVSSYEGIGKSILSQVEQLSNDPTLMRYLLVKNDMGYIDQQGLIDYATDMKRLLNLDYLTIIGPDGVALARGHDPALFGDSLSSDSVFAEALKGQKVQSLDKIRYGDNDMLTILALTPIWYQNNELIGVIAGGNFLDEDFCHNLQALSGAEILLVQGNTLLAKTIAGRVDEMSFYQNDKETFRTKLQGLWYTFYRYPLKDINGNSIADLLMGVSTHDLDILFDSMRVIYGGFAIGGLILAIIFGYISSRSFTKPIESLTWAADRLASGDFATRVDYKGQGELGNLIDTFNSMAQDLEDYKHKLIESERLSAFTMMARKVAHEIKNPLTPIRIAIQDLRRAYAQTSMRTTEGSGDRMIDSSDPKFAEAFEQSTRTVLEEVQSLTRIVEEFSNFAKFPAPRLESDDLNEIIRTILPLFAVEIQKGSIKLELAQSKIPILADRDQIKRAAVNLVKNALEAIPQSGRVIVNTAIVDRTVMLTILDDGTGLSETAKQNLFTPYFTTKPGGSGLGLVIVKRIISEHDGKIKIADQATGGTAAVIELPLYAG
jgi:two-component system nitrogen regulation sensor histidine kinase NtrY